MTTIEATLATDRIDAMLRDIVAQIVRLEDRPERITPEANLFDLGLDSLSVVALLTSIEQRFDIEIDVEDIGGGLFESYDALLSFVRSKLALG